jgi:hypothetical protein
MKRLSLASVLALAAVLFLTTGCNALLAPPDENQVDHMPWNTPAGWEGKSLGIPY